MRRHDATSAPWAPVRSNPQAIPAGAELSRETPSRPADLVGDVLVPALQALITGGLLAGLATWAAVAAGYPGRWLPLAGGLGLGIAAVVWVFLLADTRRLLWQAERLIGADLDGDRRVGRPAERLVVVNAAQAQGQANQAEQSERRSQFAEFVAALPQLGTDARTWEPRIGRDTYQDYRDTLLRLGWARRKGRGERAGWALVVDPAEILERIG